MEETDRPELDISKFTGATLFHDSHYNGLTDIGDYMVCDKHNNNDEDKDDVQHQHQQQHQQNHHHDDEDIEIIDSGEYVDGNDDNDGGVDRSTRMKQWFNQYYHALITYQYQRKKRLEQLGDSATQDHIQLESDNLRRLRSATRRDFKPLYIFGKEAATDSSSASTTPISSSSTISAKRSLAKSFRARRTSEPTAVSPETRDTSSDSTRPVHFTPGTVVHTNRQAHFLSVARSPPRSPFTSNEDLLGHVADLAPTIKVVQFSSDTNNLPSTPENGHEMMDRRRTKSYSSLNKPKLPLMGGSKESPANFTPHPLKYKSYTMMFNLDPKAKLEQTEKLLQEKEEDTRIAAEIGKSLLEKNELLEEEIKALRASHIKQAESIERATDDNGRLRTENLMLTSRIQSAVRENEMLIEREAELMEQLDHQQQWLRNEYSPMKAKTINQQRREIELLKQDVEDLHMSEEALKKTRDRLASQNQNLNSSMYTLQNALEDSVDPLRYDELLAKVAALKFKNTALQARIKQLQDASSSQALLTEPEHIIKSAFEELMKNEELLVTMPSDVNHQVLSNARFLLRRLQTELTSNTGGETSLIATLIKYLEDDQQQQAITGSTGSTIRTLNESNESNNTTDDAQTLNDPQAALYMLVCVVSIYKYTTYDKKRLESERSTIEELDSEVGTLKKVIASLEYDLGEAKMINAKLEEDIDLLKTPKPSHTMSMADELRTAFINDNSTKELAELQERHDREITQMNQQHLSDALEIESLRHQLDQLKAKGDQEIAAREARDKEVRNLKAALEQSQRQQEDNARELSTQLDKLRVDLEQVSKDKDNQIASLQSEITLERSGREADKALINQLREEKNTLLGEHIVSINALNSKLKQAISHQDQSEQHESRIAKLDQDCQTRDAQIAALNHKIEQLNQAFQEAMGAAQTSSCATLSTIDGKLQHLQDKLDAAQDKIKLQQAAIHQQEVAVQQQLMELETKKELLFVELQNEKENNDTLVQENSQLKYRMDKIQIKMEDKTRKHGELVRELSQQLTHLSTKTKSSEEVLEQALEAPNLEQLLKDYNIEEELPLIKYINHHLPKGEDIEHVFPIDPTKHIAFSIYDGVLLCKLVNLAKEGTIDTRVMNQRPSRMIEAMQNLSLVANSARAIGCIINDDTQKTVVQDPRVAVSLLFQLVRVHLVSSINIRNYPSLLTLRTDKENPQHFAALSPSQLLHRWLKYHLALPSSNKDSLEDIILNPINCIKLMCILDKELPSPSTETEPSDLYKWIVDESTNRFNLFSWMSIDTWRSRNPKLAYLFVASLFLSDKGIGIDMAVDSQSLTFAKELSDLSDVDGTREERAFCMWLNSLNLTPYVNNLQQDLQDGLIILQMFNKIKPSSVNWKLVNLTPTNNYMCLENCNIGIEVAKTLKFSLVGIGGRDIREGNRKLTLALIWQACKYHLLSILRKDSGVSVTESDTIRWANHKVASSGPPGAHHRTIDSFKDPTIGNGLFLIDLLEAMSKGCINYSVVTPGESEQDRKLNAQYIINIGRKLDCSIFLVWEDIVEVRQKLIMTLVAQLYIKSEGLVTSMAATSSTNPLSRSSSSVQ
ncbi:hypothetical protein SAMD00019534_075830 [Acytostelium subglobosum LB1]|uniref:hypothetical protein n=1 Tax=Acytostelium subglobosum LB1 TaxID=1410327 RepID=UPI000644B03D|nr:hypothetical protein SAMD00019534_075830 [Acytostelium subglobosum LB1]GAM24408.1 hypothetical protein SAMD00019534_075830 [Acytostelium subglobosum LB1]|eukprot:XP_012752734.1 hypothetical protein SAMD00019534_075830 [Acytostelium subglobosum LB1]